MISESSITKPTIEAIADRRGGHVHLVGDLRIGLAGVELELMQDAPVHVVDRVLVHTASLNGAK